MEYFAASAGNFIDASGRTLILRGVNLGGSSKVPLKPDGSTHLNAGLYDGAQVSFVGRPFPLEEADEHFSRLARWGQRIARLLVTWEAIEHSGPGIYDSEYLDYLERIVESAARRDILIYIDPHQDVWSRWTGGDGAPMWTLEAVGFEPKNLQASGAAMLHQEMGEDYPQMQWFSNHLRLACATMFTLFFAGNELAPGILAGGESIQNLLQNHYIEAIAQVARRLAPHPNVLGFGSMNEPGEGFIGVGDAAAARHDVLLPGLAPTPWETMRAGEGLPVDVSRIEVRGGSLRSVGRVQLGTPGVRAWREGEVCVWRRAGLWDIEGDRPVLKRPKWFAATVRGLFSSRCLAPFVQKFAARMDMERAQPFMIFVESSPLGGLPNIDKIPGIVNESHWYDSLTLTLKRWTGFLAYDAETRRVIVGPRAVRRYFESALSRVVQHSRERLGGCPTLLGEFGLPYDLNGGIAYRTGSFATHERALSAYYDALDANLLSATIWNYTADNNHARGDGWNGEDLSVFCGEDGGGRALAGFVRPYAMAVAGSIRSMRFSARRGIFELEFAPDQNIDAPSLVFVPMLQFPHGALVSAAGGTFSEPSLKIEDKKTFTLPVAEDEGYFVLNLRADFGAEHCALRVSRVYA